ncbi:MAG TPA: amino acid adenylation domain-containing protein, partial [Longimicrobium sp.]|nr:amino acid adenylation domain-containing protein [Longimicrobium sp.]
MTDPTSRRAGLSPEKLALLRRRLGGDATAAKPRETIPRAPGPGPAYPMSFAQARMWFVAQYDPENPMYNVPGAAMIDADVDVEALERAFTLAVRRHMGLRTVFRMVEGELQQVVLDPFPARVEVRDIRDRVRGIEDVERAVSEESARPFDLAEGPLFRVTLLRVYDDRYAWITTLHHIITDGWSSLVLGREVDGFYGDYVAGREPSPPEPELQYPDYAVWQRQWMSGERLQQQVAFWRERLAGAPALELPTDRPRPPEQSFRGAFEAFRLPERLARALRQVGKEESATLNMVILAAFATLMGKWAGQDDLVVGTILGNRNRPEVEGLIGLLANTAALRLDLSGDPDFREAVRRARRAVLDASAHQDLPFEKLVEELQLERDPSRQAVFQAMYFHHTYVAAHQTHDGGLSDLLNARPIHEDADTWMIDVGVAKFDLTFTTIEMEDGGLSGLLEYATDLFDASTMGRFARQLAAVLESASAQPDLPLSRVSLLDDAERRRVLSEWSITAAVSPRAPFHRLFVAWAARTPDAPALAGAGGERLTYAELNARANRLARRLAALGVGPESIVAVSLERSAEMVVALLAVLKAGGAFLPIDPEYPAQRRAWMVEDSSPRVIVTRSSLVPGLPATDAAVVEIDALAGEIDREDDANLPVEVELENAAYVIFTSGSTGRPKGVVVPHRGIGNLADAQREAFAISPESRVLQLASFSFDAAVAEVAHALLNGACLVLAPSARTAGPELVSFLREERVTVATMPPSLLSALPDEALPALETVVSAGEAAHPETVRRWGAGRRFVNAYGPTETTVCATVAVDPSPEAGRIPVGRPIPNVRAYVLDAAMNPLPAGVPGELYVGAIGVARGYLGKPGMTAERFVPDPYSGEPGARLYRTGDRARWTEGGELEFFGRIDTQVKVRGFRVELEEVENALLAHPGVRAAAAAVREDVPGHPRLVGYVVSANGSGADTAAVRAFVRERLPEHMVPAAVVELAVLPLSPSGKVDRAALPAPQAAAPDAGFTAPRGAAEETLARIWAQVLRRERVGVHDNFFELGGDSILSIQVIVRAAREGVRITPRQVFQHQTIAELAAAAEGATEGARAEQGAVTGEAPLTPVQRWFFAHELPRPHHWNMGMLLEARVPVDPALLARAGEAVLAHHDALRTRFERTADGWRQSFSAPEGAPPVDVFDLSAVADDAMDEEMNARASEVHASLDFTRGPTVRLALFDLGPSRPARIIAAVHHLVIDAVSWTAVAEDLDAAYRALAAGKDIDLPPKTTPFRDWARRLAEHARSPEMKAEAAYWLDAIPAIVPPVPVDDPEAPDTESGISAAFAELDEEETRALLEEVPAAYRTQVNDALLAALAMAYREWSGRESVLVEVEGHGREDLFPELDVSRTVGWFTTAHPVLLRALEGGPGETLKEVKETLRAIPGRGIGFGILRWMGDDETAARLAALPAPGISFNYLGQAAGAEEDRESALVRVGGPLGAVRAADTPRGHRIAVDGAVVEGRLRLGFFYGGASYRPGTVERLAAAYEAALRSLIDHCGGPGGGGGGGFTP